MKGRTKLAILLAACAALPWAVTSCSSGGGGTNPPADTTAPVVLQVAPHHGESSVGLDDDVLVVFSEAMDPASAAGQVTLSHGAGDLVWESADSLRVLHDLWPEGTEVTLAVGAGLRDAAGNALAAARTAAFWTWSSQPRLLASTPDSGATGQPTNVSLLLTFSTAMDLASLAGAIAVSPGNPAFTLDAPDWSVVRLTFAGPLAPATPYTVVVGTGAVSASLPPQSLAAPATIAFTTGTTADTTPPTIVSTLPARGAAGVSASTAQAVITFSEPVQNDAFEPERVAAQAFAWVIGEPVWSAGNTVLTLDFRTPLPAGVRFYVVLGAGTYRDLVGNLNTVADSLSFTVAGAPDYLPLREGAWYEFRQRYESSDRPRDSGENTIWVSHENVEGNGRFDRVRWRGAPGQDEDDRMHFQLLADGLKLRGFYDQGAAASRWLSPVVDYLPLPLRAMTWSGTSGADGADLAYEGHVLGQEALVTEIEEGPRLRWDGCWKATLYHAMSAGGELHETGTDTLWVAPGVGIVQVHSSNQEYDGGVVTRTYWSRDRLTGLDPFGH